MDFSEWMWRCIRMASFPEWTKLHEKELSNLKSVVDSNYIVIMVILRENYKKNKMTSQKSAMTFKIYSILNRAICIF